MPRLNGDTLCQTVIGVGYRIARRASHRKVHAVSKAKLLNASGKLHTV
jgi:hypothetical protein